MRRLLAAAALVTAACAIPSTADARAFRYGVASAEVTSKSAVVWARALKAGKVHLEVALDRKFRRQRLNKVVFAKRSNDLTVQTRISGLIPSRRYYYFFHQGRQRSLLGTFKTAPRASKPQTIRFAVTGDADPSRVNGHNFWNKDGSRDMATYAAMAKEKNDFNVNLGDTIYSDAESGPPAFNLDAKRQKYRLGLTYPSLLLLRDSAAVYNQWDDHEFVDDFNRHSQGCDVGSVFTPQYPCNTSGIWRAGVKAFREYMPVTYSKRNGTYRTFRWGRNLQIFILDERSFRSLRASEVKVNPSAPEPTAHVCENGGNDDVAPRVPQRIRNLFSLVVPSLANPVPPACLAALNDPKRTMLGDRQYSVFTNAIKNSTAKWKLIINEVPMMEAGINPYDDWEGYEAEREKLLTFLKGNVKNVAILTTDFHTNWVNDARIKTWPEDGGPVNSGIKEFIAGGVADSLFGEEIDKFAGSSDTWKLVDSAYLRKPPPDGPGMECSNPVTYGYAQVVASSKTLQVELKDNRGRQIRNSTGDTPCGPWKIAAK